ncbi:MAG: hypothetical protein Q7R86_03235 [bacterium]|nr:hypothetical protein [bacterium]
MFVPLPKGFSFDIWMSTGTDFKPNFGREIDVILGWSDKLFGVGLSYYDLNNILSTKTTDIVLPFAEVHPTLTSNNHKFTTFARVEYNFCTRQSNVNSAVDLAVGMKHVWQINKVFSVNHRLRVAYYDGLFASKSGFVTRWDVGLSAKMTKQVNLNLSVKNSIPERSMTDRQNLTSFGIGVSSSFP